MKRNVIVFGIVLGTILAAGCIWMMNIVYNSPDLQTNDILGWAVIILICSLVFFGIRNYRNKELSGVISFGKAFMTGTLIVLLGATIFTVAGLSYYYLVVPDYMDKVTELALNQATRQGATAAELAEVAERMERTAAQYENPIIAILLTYSLVLMPGLVVVLVSSLILRRNPGSKENV